MRRTFIACMLVLSAIGQSYAQVYRCERGSSLSYSDHPCERSAKETRKNFATSNAAGTLDVNITVTHYPVQGQDYPTLLNSLNANGPKGYHGLASWNIQKEFATKSQRDGCQMAEVHLKVTGQILMPRWDNETSAPLDLQQRWSTYYAALKRHEDGHIQHGRELALLVRERLMGLGTLPCDQINATAEREFKRIYGNLKARDEEYDARTNHGVTQRASF